MQGGPPPHPHQPCGHNSRAGGGSGRAREGEKSWAMFLLRNQAEHGVLLPQASSPPETAEEEQDLLDGKIVSEAEFAVAFTAFLFCFLALLVGVLTPSSCQCVLVLNSFFPRGIEMALLSSFTL